MYRTSGLAILAGVVLSLVLLFASCSSDSETAEAKALFQKYVKVSRTGDEAALVALYAPESQPFVRLYPKQVEKIKRATWDVIKVVPYGNYYELQVLAGIDGNQTATFYYAVKTANGLRLQYPFAVFAEHWPAVQSTHFVVHSRALQESSLLIDSLQGRSPDTAALESFLSRLCSMTGNSEPQLIHYYHCSDIEEAYKLCGNKSQAAAHFGPCVVTWRPFDIQQVAYAVLLDQPQPIDFLVGGVAFWAELQAPMPDDDYRARSLRTISRSVALLDTVPIERLVSYTVSDTGATQQFRSAVQIVGGIVVQELLERADDTTFSRLYKASTSPAEFEQQLSDMYGLTFADLRSKFLATYRTHMPPAIAAGTSGGSVQDSANSYREISVRPRDLKSDLVDIRYFQSEHCWLQFSSEYVGRVAEIVDLAERAYMQVASDFGYQVADYHPSIAILSFNQYRQATGDRSGGRAVEITPDSIQIYINSHVFGDNSGRLESVIRHELAHMIFFRFAKPGATHSQARHDFEEALCSLEEGRPSPASEYLKVRFPNGRFFTFAESDTLTNEQDLSKSIDQYRVLVDLIVAKHGRQVLPRIARSLRNEPVDKMLEEVCGVPWSAIEQEWHQRLQEIYSGT